MDATEWNERYRGADLLWTSAPNRWIEHETSLLPPGKALDVAAGEGRHAIWLAQQGWEVTAVDFSTEAIDRGRSLAADLAARIGVQPAITWEVDDVTRRELPSAAYDLVLLSYVHVPSYDRRDLVRGAAQAVAPGGTLVIVGHDTTNVQNGYGGPEDPDVLYTAADLEDDISDLLASGSFGLERGDRVAREVETDDGPRTAWDVVFTVTRRDMNRSGFHF